MIIRSTFAALAIFLYFVIVSSLSATSKTKDASPQDGVKDLLTMQSEAWNNGDLDKFLTGYVNSNEISYVSSESEVWGYEALRQRYVKKYGESRDTMGELSFSDLKVQSLGAENALCIGHWHLKREGKDTLNGIFSLVLVKTKSGWKILHDHTSVTK